MGLGIRIWKNIFSDSTKYFINKFCNNIRIKLPKLVFYPTMEENSNEKKDLNKKGLPKLHYKQFKKRLCDDDNLKAKHLKIDALSDQIFVRRKFRKYILLMSYCGKGYLGMQKNKGFQTIEEDLLKSMFNANLIQEEGIDCPQIYKFQRAARTDKGVSAVRQIVSLKLPEDVEDISSAINKSLSPQIRVMKCVRVTQKFDAKNQCDARTYSYLIPSFAFAPPEFLTNEKYRISNEVLIEIRNIFQNYKGTHNFHNFTAKVLATSPSAKRYIMEMTCSEPFIRDNMEWILIKVKGQSFMLHQIRKMIGLTIGICRGFIKRSVFEGVYNKERYDIPIAPSLGLVLEEPHYNYYNRKYLNDGVHEQLNWMSIEDKIEEFRETFINSEIIRAEKEENVTLKWLETLNFHAFDLRENETEKQVQSVIGTFKARGQVRDLIDNEHSSNLEPEAEPQSQNNEIVQTKSEDLENLANSKSDITTTKYCDSLENETNRNVNSENVVKQENSPITNGFNFEDKLNVENQAKIVKEQINL